MKTTRNTVQRVLVLDAVRRMDGHPTAEKICRMVREQNPRISRGTVYRNLNLLVERGEVLRVRTPEGPDCFDHRLQAHSHIRCRLCGRVFDLEVPHMPELDGSLGETAGFLVERYDLSFSGVCPHCRERDEGEEADSIPGDPDR